MSGPMGGMGARRRGPMGGAHGPMGGMMMPAEKPKNFRVTFRRLIGEQIDVAFARDSVLAEP